MQDMTKSFLVGFVLVNPMPKTSRKITINGEVIPDAKVASFPLAEQPEVDSHGGSLSKHRPSPKLA